MEEWAERPWGQQTEGRGAWLRHSLGSKLKPLKMCEGLLNVVVKACKMWPEGLGVW